MKILGLELADLTVPVSEAEPCGPDFDRLGDPDYLNVMANAEGLLPASYFDFIGKENPWPKIDFAAQYAGITQFLAKSRDLRLLSLLAKLVLINRDLPAFVACIDGIAALLNDRWDSVHPTVEGDDLDARLAPLRALDDFPLIALALQHLPLVESRRSGTITYRSYLVATGQANLRSSEEAFDAPTIQRELDDADLDKLKEIHAQLSALRAGFNRIEAVSLERAGGEAIDLGVVGPLVAKIIALLEGAIAKRDPGAVPQSAGAAASPQSEDVTASAEGAPAALRRGKIGSVAEAAAALAGIAEYFSRSEPSSPALFLTRQAQALIGRSLLEVMQILIPEKVDAAAFQIGVEQTFSLPLRTAETLAAVEDPGAGEPGNSAPAMPATAVGTEDAPFEVAGRREAVALLEDVGIFFRAREPSSPIPLLTDRARGLAERDFPYLLQQMLPG